MEFFEEVIYEMYGFTLLEFLFYALDALVISACFIALLVSSIKLNRRINSKDSRLLLYSCIAVLVLSILSGVVSEYSYQEGDTLSLAELLVVYSPSVAVVFLTIGLLRVLKSYKGGTSNDC
ncbi:hypothetical protein FJ444_21175 [Aestuariibacter sp. GS-14]|uniref:hypothetical protein n=1 Tax=Aestuariibacter sp. GS-14 TaxID=2590670 RepID=UPI00112E1047|nr:hypothetical protein [Aestuariibacter sp. GS-14]TPV52219.1 hypothetical protein FJ444_21175 [Aestuariibacter sp. GS-14]